MDLNKELKYIKAKEDVLNFISIFGLKEEVNHIISPEDKKPVVTFEPKTKEEYKKVMTLFKPSIYNIVIKESNGTTGFKPIDKYTNIEESDNITLLDYGLMIETITIKHENKIKIRFFIEWTDKNKFIDVWVSVPLEWFKDSFQFEEITDVHETQTARQYNHRHTEIKTKIPIFKGFIEVVKFWGGHYTFYSVNEKQTEYLKEVVLNE